MTHHRTKAGKDQSRARLVTGEHVMRATLMRRFAMRHAATDGEFVSHLREILKVLSKAHPCEFRLDIS